MVFKSLSVAFALLSLLACPALGSVLEGEKSGTKFVDVTMIKGLTTKLKSRSVGIQGAKPEAPTFSINAEYLEGRNTNEEFENYKYYFEKKLEKGLKVGSSHNPFEPSALHFTIDKQKFLSCCALANLGNIDGSRKCLLVVFHYNIPVTQTTLIPVRYGYARFNCKLTNLIANNDGTLFEENPVKVISISPQNEVLKINRNDRTRFEIEMKPEWMAASGGRMNYQKEITDIYDYQLPKVVGTTSKFGDVSWTYYPAKAQNIIYGEQTAYAIISVPANTKAVHLMCDLSYQLRLLKYVPGPTQRVFDTLTLSTGNEDLPDWTAFKKAHFTDLPDGLLNNINSVIDPRRTYAVEHGNSDTQGTIVIESTAGKVYKVSGTKLEPIQENAQTSESEKTKIDPKTHLDQYVVPKLR